MWSWAASARLGMPPTLAGRGANNAPPVGWAGVSLRPAAVEAPSQHRLQHCGRGESSSSHLPAVGLFASGALLLARGVRGPLRSQRPGLQPARPRTACAQGAPEQSGRGPLLRGGRPCAYCGQLAETGCFSADGNFYHDHCLATLEQARKAREGDALVWSGSLGVGQMIGSWEAAVFARAERSIIEGSMDGLRACLLLWPAICSQRGSASRTLLHWAARAGNLEAAQVVLDTYGARYGKHVELSQCLELSQDVFGITPGELAFAGGHQDVFDLLVASACDRPRASNFSGEHNKAYVKQKLKYDGDVLYDADGKGVMMGWETPLMARHAALIAEKPGKAVLNVGFGLGIIDGQLDETQPRYHCIAEAHPDVYQEITNRGWLDKAGVQVVFGRWQDTIDQIAQCGPFDGIFWDTYAEMYGDMQEFFMQIPQLLSPGGRFSFFNGMSDKNIFTQAISCRVAQLDLSKLGLVCLYEPVNIGALEGEWSKVVLQYWSLETYYVPIAFNLGAGQDASSVQQQMASLRSNAVQVGDRVGACLDGKIQRAAAAGF